MAEERIFVGRKEELEQFRKVLEDPKGQAILVVGQAGMGKTWLTHKMAEIAENHPDLKCGWVRYEVTPTDSVDSTMALMMDNAFEAASSEPGSFDKVPQRKKQWMALLKAVVPKGGEIAELIGSLRRDPQRNTREQFLSRLELISKRMPGNGRAVFIIDPEKYMQKESDQSWAIVVKDLPEKIKFVFAQRPEDVLVDSETFGNLNNTVSIPEKRLDVLEEEAVDELLTQRIKGAKYTVTEIREVLSRYEGHPYALGAALDLLEVGTKLEELPEKPEPTQFAAVQWNEVSKKSEDAIRLFKAYAILEVGVGDDVVEAVSEIEPDKRQHLTADKFLRGLLREEGEGRRIYHAILADYIVGQIEEGERKEIHGRVVRVYRVKLKKAEEEQTKPDALAAIRLAEHVLEAEGEKAFLDAFVNECFGFLLRLGLLDAATGLSMRALKFVKKDSKYEVSVMGDIGIIYKMRGALNKAEEIFKRILEIHKKIGPKKDMASDCANLGEIYVKLGMLEQAEKMFESALEIDQKLGNVYEVGDDYGKFGVLYIKRKDFHKAEQVLIKAITIHEEIERFDGVATNCGNLGRLYIRERKYDLAERMFLKALELHKKLGWIEGLAHDNVNLGSIHKERGDVAKAREYGEKAVELYKRIGMPHRVEEVEAWIDKLNIKKQNDKLKCKKDRY